MMGPGPGYRHFNMPFTSSPSNGMMAYAQEQIVKLDADSVFGIDIGGVIITKAERNPESKEAVEDTIFGENYLQSQPVFGAFEAIQCVVDALGADSVHLVSKAGARTEERTKEWLEYTPFYEITELDRGNVHFCRQREGKVAICAEHCVTHFIDDRLDNLKLLAGTVPHLFFFQPVPESGGMTDRMTRDAHEAGTIPGCRVVRAWEEVVEILAGI